MQGEFRLLLMYMFYDLNTILSIHHGDILMFDQANNIRCKNMGKNKPVQDTCKECSINLIKYNKIDKD